MAEVSVLDYGADPTGVGDSTPAFLSAQRAAAGGTVKIPKGDYRIQPDRQDFLWWATRWIGESHTNYPERCSRILPYGPGGNVLVNLPGKGDIESLIIDCENIVQTGLHVAPGHGSYLRDVTVYNARDYGAKFIGSTLTAYGVGVTRSMRGLLLQGCNGSAFIAPRVTHCCGVGIEVQGGASGLTTLSGGLTIYGAEVDMCGKDGQSPLVLFRGVEGGFYQFYYLEGADGIWLNDNTHNCTFIGTRCVLGGNKVLLRLNGARMCTFIGFSAPSEATMGNRVIVNATNSYENEFYNMSRESRHAANPTGLEWQDNFTPPRTWTAYERDGRLQSSGPPTIGRWERGQVIENAFPVSGAPYGWVCVAGGPPGTWKPLAPIGA